MVENDYFPYRQPQLEPVKKYLFIITILSFSIVCANNKPIPFEDQENTKVEASTANQIAGLIPFSGHAITHFTVRQEMGIPGEQPIIDNMAPLYHVRADA